MDADELRPFGIFADDRQHPAEWRFDNASQDEQRGGGDEDHHDVISLAGVPARNKRHRIEPREARIGNTREALIAAREVIRLERDSPGDLRKGEGEHAEEDAGEPDAEETEQEREDGG